jgi:oligopeptide/dipeptide ABC transporter ATP-binding protein
MAIILITHDLGVIAEVADEVVVMYAGSVMERAERRELFYDYRHPYTIGLLRSLPSYDGIAAAGDSIDSSGGAPLAPEAPLSTDTPLLDAATASTEPGEPARKEIRRRLYSIPGQPPSLLGLAPGCPFVMRCTHRMGRCETERPPMFTVSPTHFSACWLEAIAEVGSPAEDLAAPGAGAEYSEDSSEGAPEPL